MKIIVVGCGKIGKTIIATLVKEGHEVVAVDVNRDVVKEVNNLYDVMCICGNGTEYERLKEAGVKTADLFIAATSSDELNMLSCFAAKRMGANYTVARIRDAENNGNYGHDFMKAQLGLSMAINPELQTAIAVYNVLKLPSASMVEMFSSQRLEMVHFSLREDSPLDGVSLMDLRRSSNEKFLVCAVSRGERGEEVCIPQGNFRLKSGDKIGVIANGRDTHKVMKALGVSHKQVRNVLIMGGGKTSRYLAQMLVESRISVKVIEKDPARCIEFCENVPGATVIQGNGMNQDLLLEEGIASCDAFVALTGHDEENILISFYAKSLKNSKVITKVNREELSAIAENLGLDCIVSPKKITADILGQYARALNKSEGSTVETLYSLMNDRIEALEFNVLQDFEYNGKRIKDMAFREGVLIAGIVRGHNAIIPDGDDCILAGDKVIVIVAGQHVYDLASLIKGVK